MRRRLAALVVEGQDFMRRMLVEYVHSAYPDISVMDAADGARALQRCRSGSPRLVLMDVALPDANGIEFTAKNIVAQIDEFWVKVVTLPRK